jgi:hypothetical protein
MLDFPIPGPLQMRTAILAGMVWERSVRSCEGLTAETIFMGISSYRGVIASRSGQRRARSGQADDDGIVE